MAEVHEAPAAISIEETAQRLGICVRTAYARAHDGSLPTVRLGTRLLVPVHRLQALLDGK